MVLKLGIRQKVLGVGDWVLGVGLVTFAKSHRLSAVLKNNFMKRTFLAFAILLVPALLFAQGTNNDNSLNYKIFTGQYEKGAAEIQGLFGQLFGTEETQHKFDTYFHWYNVAHEYSHCILDFYGKSVGSVQEEILANKFAVKYWESVGFDEELAKLKVLLEERLSTFSNPVPEGKTFEEWYTEIWGSSKLMEVSVYGYLQFKSVLIAMEDDGDLESWFSAVDISDFTCPKNYKSGKYPTEAASAAKYLNDLQGFFKSSGFKVPAVGVELVDDPMTQCSRKVE